MAWFCRKVTVEFIDEADGAVFASSIMPVDDLPDSFEIDTTLHLGESDWSVVRAEPLTKKDFSKTGKLRIRLRKIETMDPNAIGFSQLV